MSDKRFSDMTEDEIRALAGASPDPEAILSAMSERDRRVAIGYPREPEDVPRLIGAVRVALGHHEPQETANGFKVCPKCSRAAGSMVRAPCPEVAAITRELTGEEKAGG